MFSTVPAVRVALVDLFAAALSEPTDPKVFYGHPGQQIPDRYVAVGSAIDPVERTIRRFPHNTTSSVDENYTVVVQVRIKARGQGPAAQRAVFEECYSLADRMDQALRADYRLESVAQADDGSPLVTSAHMTNLDLAEGPLHEGWESVITATVAIKAAGI